MIRSLFKGGLSIILALGIATGCGIIPSPEETIQPPSTPGTSTDKGESDLTETVMGLLPDGAEIVTPSVEDGDSPIIFGDLNGNGADEAVLVYRTADQANQLKAVIFTEEQGEWRKLWEETGQGYDLDYMELADLDGDGLPELLLGWTIGASAGSGLDIYGWVEEEMTLLDQTGYNRIELQDIDGENGGKAIALWIKDTGIVFAVEVLRLSEKKLVPAPNMYPHYFPQVVAYYQEQVEDSPDSAILWYYLADAQIKSGHTDDALISIAEANKLEPDSFLNDKLQDLEQKAKENVEYVLAHTQIGRSQEEVLQLFGDHYVEVMPAMETPGVVGMWRYDAILEDSYELDNELDADMDWVDIEGLKEGKLRYQLFVSWDEDGTARGFTLYYLENNKVYEYRLWPDGGETVKEIG